MLCFSPQALRAQRRRRRSRESHRHVETAHCYPSRGPRRGLDAHDSAPEYIWVGLANSDLVTDLAIVLNLESASCIDLLFLVVMAGIASRISIMLMNTPSAATWERQAEIMGSRGRASGRGQSFAHYLGKRQRNSWAALIPRPEESGGPFSVTTRPLRDRPEARTRSALSIGPLPERTRGPCY